MMEKILFITAYVPHKAAAGEKNTMIMLNDLAESYDVDLVYFKYDYDKPYLPERNNVKVLKVFKNSKSIKIWGILNLPFLHPVYSIRFSWSKLITLKKLMGNTSYKAIVLNHSNVFYYGKFLDKNTPKILLAHDVIIQRALRTAGKMMQHICRYSERLCFNLPYAHIFSFSQKDVDIIKREYHLPAKVCLDYIDPDIINKRVETIEDYYMFFGDWTRKENYEGALWFIENVSPLLKEKTTFKIIGRGFPIDKMKNSNHLVKYEVLGFVDDPYKILSEAKALVSALFNGAGIKVKVIESLACGTPVIGTEIAFEGLPKGFESSMLLANTPEEYVQAMTDVTTDVEVRKKLRSDFIECYSKDNIRHYIDKL